MTELSVEAQQDPNPVVNPSPVIRFSTHKFEFTHRHVKNGIRFESIEDQIGAITVASTYDPEHERLTYGVAFCSSDDRFDKRKGQNLATERLCNPLHKFNGSIHVTKGKMGHYMGQVLIFSDILIANEYPNWAQLSLMEIIQSYSSSYVQKSYTKLHSK